MEGPIVGHRDQQPAGKARKIAGDEVDAIGLAGCERHMTDEARLVGAAGRSCEVEHPQRTGLLVRHPEPGPPCGIPHHRAALVVARETREPEGCEFVIRILRRRIDAVLTQTEGFVAREQVPALRIDRQRLDLLATAPLAERTHEQPGEATRAVVDQPVLVEIALLGRMTVRAAHGDEQRAVHRPHPSRDTHDITGALALEHLDAPAIDRLHAGERVDAQAVGETLGDDGNIHRLATQHHAAGDVDVVRAQQAAHHPLLLDPAIETENIECAVDILVGADDQRARRISRIDPYGRVVGIVADGLADHPWLHRRSDGRGLGCSDSRRPRHRHGEQGGECDVDLAMALHRPDLTASVAHPRIRCSRTARTRRPGSADRSSGCPWSWSGSWPRRSPRASC